ncbi:hypothetical protein B0H14DRAFT_2653867 [Mycena olivaceomarginata]|nr:hypothetical protein B0H14DRAFT_2653867 [Mycena olivaceomarginata]
MRNQTRGMLRFRTALVRVPGMPADVQARMEGRLHHTRAQADRTFGARRDTLRVQAPHHMLLPKTAHGILPDGPTHRVYLIEHRDLGLAPYAPRSGTWNIRARTALDSFDCHVLLRAIESMDSGRDSGDAVSISIYVNIFTVGISAS